MFYVAVFGENGPLGRLDTHTQLSNQSVHAKKVVKILGVARGRRATRPTIRVD